MCRFPASGSSRKSFARGCVPMDDPGCWQWVTREEIIQSIPVEPTPTIPTRQPFLPDPDDLIGVPAQSFDVARDAVVGIVAPHHHRQMGVLVPDGLMPVGPTPICNRRQRAGVTALARYLPHAWVKPRKVNEVLSVSGWLVPFGLLSRKSTKRVLSRWSVSPYRASRLPRTPRTRLASRESSNAITASSANL